MFQTKHWAAAFLNAIEREKAEFSEAVTVLELLASRVKKIPGPVFGHSAAIQTEKLIRASVQKSAVSRNENFSIDVELGIRLIVLLIRKNSFQHIDAVIEEIKKIEAKRSGIVKVTAEYAFPSGDYDWQREELRLKEAIIKRTGAREVEIAAKPNPDLIGGFRLRIGDEIVDASVRARIRQLQAHLAGVIDGGN